MKESVYIITKPLQYINATNILDSSKKTCLLVDHFDKSIFFYNNINKISTYWSKTVWCKSRYAAFLYVLKQKKRYDTLYIDTDMGMSNRFFLLLLSPIKIIIYEEGFGNYRREIRKKEKGLKSIFNFIDSFTGKNYIGGFKNTNEIYLHHPNAFYKLVDEKPNKKILQFKNNFEDHLSSLKEVQYSLPAKISINIAKKVLIYLTARDLDHNFKDVISRYDDCFKILKPHPQLTGKTGIQDLFDYTVEHRVLAEVLINSLMDKVEKLIVLHHGDTTLLNLKNNDKIQFLNISKNNKQIEMFEKIKTAIKN